MCIGIHTEVAIEQEVMNAKGLAKKKLERGEARVKII